MSGTRLCTARGQKRLAIGNEALPIAIVRAKAHVRTFLLQLTRRSRPVAPTRTPLEEWRAFSASASPRRDRHDHRRLMKRRGGERRGAVTVAGFYGFRPLGRTRRARVAISSSRHATIEGAIDSFRLRKSSRPTLDLFTPET